MGLTMAEFYLTFGTASRNANRYQRIVADDYAEARFAAFEAYGPRWAFLYDETQFDDAIKRYKLKELKPSLSYSKAVRPRSADQ
jgi:hypothetical protein